MYRSTAWLAVLFAPCLSAQFTGLSSTADGSSLYFASKLRLKGADQPLNGKMFVATQEGVKLFRARETEATSAPAPGESTCKVGGFTSYNGAETSAAGILALSYWTNSSGPCSGPPNINATQIVSAAGEIILPGVVRLSSGGRFAIRFLAGDGRGSHHDDAAVGSCLRPGCRGVAGNPDSAGHYDCGEIAADRQGAGFHGAA